MAENWPQWRGEKQDGVGCGRQPPLDWSTSKNVRWSTSLPGRGHSSPIIWGDDVFLAAADEVANVQSLLCYDRSTGSLRWTCEVGRGDFGVKHLKNSYASATPACDGRCVFYPFVANNALQTSAVDLRGNLAWQTRVGPYAQDVGYGYASSPAIFDGLVIVLSDSHRAMGRRERLRAMIGLQHDAFLAALDGATGEVVWRVRLSAQNQTSYGTPIVVQAAGRPQLIVPGGSAIVAYSPFDGHQIWRCRWPLARAANSVVACDNWVVASGADPDRQTICIRADGENDVTDSHVAWSIKNRGADVPSPLVVERRLVLVEDGGVASCFSIESGKLLWRHRLAGNFTASPIAIGNYVYAVNESGRTFVFRVAPKFELVAENDLNEETLASPACSGGDLFLRTRDRLWCISDGR
ncbi:MAG TPA: PQQ-binding-like beta-propeller repeat protein [Pirellulales bacterium]|nr:PQQ-binding-like beta-propeller repeat protein [Pirellulales bacterium]